MFKKLKEKIAEEVKPLKIPQFAQTVVLPGNNAFVELPPNDAFSLDDELPEDVLVNEGFSVVDLHHPSQPLPLSSGRFSRQSSMSSLASDASAFLPIHDTSLGAFNMQDMESASEREDILPQMNTISKQELCNSYLKLYRHYQKYKGRTADLKSFCVELEKDNKKLKTVLLECQEKSLRRMAELKEQCALEQHAKAHLEEALRNDLEEKDHLIQTLQTKIRLLKDAHAAGSSVIHAEFEHFHQLQGDIGDNDRANTTRNSYQEQQTGFAQENSHTRKKVLEEGEIEAFKEKIDIFREQILAKSNVDIKDDSLKLQLQDFLNYISSSFINRTSLLSSVLSSEQEKLSEQENLQEYENKINTQNLPEISDKNEKDGVQTIGSELYSSTLSPDVNLQSILLNTQEMCTVVPDQIISEKLATSVNDSETESAWTTCSCKNRNTEAYLNDLKSELEFKTVNFEKVSQELEASHQMISKRDSVISELQEKLSSLQKEAEEALNHKKKITETLDALKSELVKTKLELEEFQQQYVSAQCTIEEKEKIAKEATDNLIQINDELDKACADKIGMNQVITNLESELKETRDTCKQLAQDIQDAKNVIEERDSLIEHMKKEFSQALENLECANGQKNESNEMITSLKKEMEEMVLKFQDVNNELACISKLVEEKDSTITNLKTELNALHEDLETSSSEKIETTSLQREIKNIKADYEEISTRFQSAEEVVKEKDIQIIELNDQLNTITHKLEMTLKEKTEKEEITEKLQSDLDSANLQIQHVTQDLLWAQKSLDVKDSDFVKVTEELTKAQMELNEVLSQKSELAQTLQQLSDAHYQLEELTQSLKVASKSAEEKECELARVRGNIANIQGELNMQISINVEKCKEVEGLQNDLMEAVENFEKVTKDLETSHKLINQTNLAKELINKDLDIVRKNLEAMASEKTEAKEIANTLRNEVTNINVRLEQMTEDLKSAQKLVQEKDENSVKLSQELSVIQNDMKRIESERGEALEKVTAFQNEMLDVTAKLLCAHKLIEERDTKIACLSKEVASISEMADSTTQQKQETNEKLYSLQNELMNLQLEFQQVTQQLNSADHLIKEKDFAIAHLTEKLTNVCKELDGTVIHNTELILAVESLQHEIEEMKLKCNLSSKEIEEAHLLIEGKDSKIAHLSENLGKMHKELHSVSDLKSEESETLHKELQNSKNVCDKITQDLESAHQLLEVKNSYEEQLKAELVRVKEELDLVSTEQCQAGENIANLQHELMTTKLHLETTSQELQSANQLLGEKQIMSENVTGDLHANSISIYGDNALIASLQSELTTNNSQLEKLKQELECAQIIIDKKDSYIRDLKEELTDHYRKLGGNSFHKTDTISSTVENKGLKSAFHLQMFEHDPVSSTSVSQNDLPRAIIRNNGSENNGERCERSTRREFLSDHSDQPEYDKTLEKEISARESSSLIVTTAHTESSVVESGSFPASDKILNTSKLRPDSEEHSSGVETRSSEWCEDKRIPPNKNCIEDTYLLSQSVQQLKNEELASNRNFPEPILKWDHMDKDTMNPNQVTNIPNILEEIQKENREYGSLLECHKNIINHLERITKMQTEGIQPGSAEWLHKQLILLSQKLYDTKEKQRIQIASINNFVKHQEDLKRAGVNENHMTIEMQYLRNIVFQYMIGKETMLLAKVISAVMKFDQQQMDQVMQKELQKQTLLGQLGLL